MTFCIVQLQNNLWTTVLKECIKNRIDEKGQCHILGTNYEVSIIGCHENYRLLNNMCIQHNGRQMTIGLIKNDFSEYIAPSHPHQIQVIGTAISERVSNDKSSLQFQPRKLFDNCDDNFDDIVPLDDVTQSSVQPSLNNEELSEIGSQNEQSGTSNNKEEKPSNSAKPLLR